ncbi:hypothetical protein [Flagellimonas beolgyonensis]|uniref:hypothetical protein n=1 Tax=Flagellimonas beolgyonensis TaxID=864064 RepID=UPI000F8F3E5C|nr:hypothetical protein [Allomuricauda beolgyonensis]
MKKLLIFPLFLSALISFGQELSCDDFKEGEFISSMTEPVKIEWKIVREGSSQIEIPGVLPDELKGTDFPMNPRYGIIEWIDDCTYKLTYDSTKSELTDMQKMVNQLGGFINEMVKIEGNCFFYKSTLKYNGGEQSIEGKFCKE